MVRQNRRRIQMAFLTVRVLHVLLGGTWLGMAVVMSWVVMPALRDAGPPGGAVMAAIVKRGFTAIIASVSGLSVLTGLWLYWHFTNGFDPLIAGSMGARVFGVGGV